MKIFFRILCIWASSFVIIIFIWIILLQLFILPQLTYYTKIIAPDGVWSSNNYFLGTENCLVYENHYGNFSSVCGFIFAPKEVLDKWDNPY